MYAIDRIKDYDNEIFAACSGELSRQRHNIELIASENIVSEPVLLAASTVLTNKYAEGYPGNRYYGGCEYVDVVEAIAIDRAKQLFGAEYANVQPHSGVNANLAVLYAVLKPGDTVMGMDLSNGGHLSHGSKANISGKYFNAVSYGIDRDTQRIDYDKMLELARKHKPKMIIAGASAYSRIIDFKKFREAADEVNALLMVDIAHIAGLVAAGVHPSPVPYADFCTTTTHKTLRGPRGGLILCKQKFGALIDKAIFPGIQGGPLMHIIAAKAIAFGEALKPEFKIYAQQVIRNASVLADALIAEGFEIVSGGTDNHLMLLDVRPFRLTGKELESKLDSVHITANKNSIPDDPQNPNVTSGVRLGTPAVTTRGFTEPEMHKIAKWIKEIATDFEGNSERIACEVMALCDRFPIYT